MHPQLLKLLINNKGKGYFKADSANADEATIYLYDVIVSDDYWGGITPLEFNKQLAAITAPVIHLRINSPGGDVFAARAMQQAIKEHPSTIIAHIDGWCASAATFPALACDESVIAKGALFMIHNAWTIALGDAKELTAMAALLNRIDATIAADYAQKTGQDLQQVIDWMTAETYFIDQEAIDAGFIDAIAEQTPKNKIDWDVSAYKNVFKDKNHCMDKYQEINEEVIKGPANNEFDDEIIENHAKNRPRYREMLAA